MNNVGPYLLTLTSNFDHLSSFWQILFLLISLLMFHIRECKLKYEQNQIWLFWTSIFYNNKITRMEVPFSALTSSQLDTVGWRNTEVLTSQQNLIRSSPTLHCTTFHRYRIQSNGLQCCSQLAITMIEFRHFTRLNIPLHFIKWFVKQCPGNDHHCLFELKKKRAITCVGIQERKRSEFEPLFNFGVDYSTPW